MMNSQFNEKQVQCERLEYDINLARRELDEKNRLCRQPKEDVQYPEYR